MKTRHLLVVHHACHHAHLVTHVAYLTMVYFHSPYYGIAAGALGAVVVVSELIERTVKKREHHD